MSSSEPVVIQEDSFSIPLIFKLNYIIEDRRPDLTEEEAQKTLGYKFKTIITIKFIGYKKSFTIRSTHLPLVC